MKANMQSPLTLLLISFLVGELVTLLTGLIPSTPPGLLGAEWFGYPLAWLFRLVIAPWYNPWRVDVVNFIADSVIWFIIVAIVAFIVTRMRKPVSQ
jgi:hypothetical protein